MEIENLIVKLKEDLSLFGDFRTPRLVHNRPAARLGRNSIAFLEGQSQVRNDLDTRQLHERF